MIRVHRVTEFGDGSIEIMIHGGSPEADYVAGRLRMAKGVDVTEPVVGRGAPEFVYIVARGTPIDPLTLEAALRMLRCDEQIEVSE